MKGKFVLIRTYSAGVHFGILVERNGQEVHLRNARRLWQWSGALSLSEVAMKDVLWVTLNEIRSGDIDAGAADAVASQAREIVRTAKVQLQISTLSKRPVPTELIKFNEDI